MRGCHDPAGVRAVGRRETRIEVLLSERSPEPSRHNRSRALPIGGFIRAVVTPGKTPRNPEFRGRTFVVHPETQPAETPRPQGIPTRPDDLNVDPLYLFVCGLLWRRRSNNYAGWELIQCVRSSGQTARIAALLLAHAENIRVPARALGRAINGPGVPSLPGERGLQTSARRSL
jgi:hypothetical protein